MCNIESEMLQQYLGSELSPAETNILEEHLAWCSKCRRELNQLIILNWHLQHLASTIEVPEQELYSVRLDAINQCLAEQTSTDLKEIYNLPLKSMNNLISMMSFIPGTSLIKKAGSSANTYLKTKLSPRNLWSALSAGN